MRAQRMLSSPGSLLTPPPPARRRCWLPGQHSTAPHREMATSVSIKMPANRAASVVEDFRISGPNIDLRVLPDNLKKDCLLFYCSETAPLAKKIAAASEGKVELGDISWK